MATTEYSVHRRVERGVREVPVTPLTVPVSVYPGGNQQCVAQASRPSFLSMIWQTDDVTVSESSKPKTVLHIKAQQ